MMLRYSSIADYYSCPKKYEYKHIQGLSEPGLESADMAFGTAIHAAIEDTFIMDGNGIDKFNELWDAVKDKDLKYTKYQHGDLAKLGEVHITKFLKYHKKHLVPTFMEQKGEIPGYLQGTLDFAGTYKGIPSIIDYKTSARPYSTSKIECNEQMYIYAKMAANKGFNVEQVVYMVFVKDLYDPRIQTIIKSLTAAKHNAMLENVYNICDEIREKKKFNKNRNSCLMGEYKCAFWEKCYGEK